MIEFHTGNTSNGQRVAIMLEECARPGVQKGMAAAA